MCETWGIVLTICMRQPEIPVGKSNGSPHSVCEASEKVDFGLRRCNFYSLRIYSAYLFSHHVKFQFYQKWQIQGRGPGVGPPLFLDQTEARISFYAKDFHSGD